MASYDVNPDAVARCRELIERKQYVLDSDWGDVQPRAAQENAFLAAHSWEEYAEWHLASPTVRRTARRRATRSSTATFAACTAWA
jgi:hypothetical protein